MKASLEEKIKVRINLDFISETNIESFHIQNLEQTVQSLKFQAQLKDKKAETASTTTTNPTTNLAFKKLQIEREQFEKYRVDQVSKIEAMREDEMKRLRREKLAWEKQRKAGEILPSKK